MSSTGPQSPPRTGSLVRTPTPVETIRSEEEGGRRYGISVDEEWERVKEREGSTTIIDPKKPSRT